MTAHILNYCFCLAPLFPGHQAPSSSSSSSAQTLSAAKLLLSIRRKIEKVVLLDDLITNPYDQEDAEEHATVERVRLSTNGRQGLRVWGGGPFLCGKSNCFYWIFDGTNGSLLLAGNGYQLAFKKTLHGGLYDVEAKQQLGERDTALIVYGFDGRRYRPVKSP